MPPTSHRHAVVIGASIAGLSAARAVADHFDTVTVLDRDALSAGAEARKGVPQGRHAHALLAGGALAAEQLFPGILAEMTERGAASIDFNDGVWHHAGGYRAASLLDRRVVSASRPVHRGVAADAVSNAMPTFASVPVSGCTAWWPDGERVAAVRVEDDGRRHPVDRRRPRGRLLGPRFPGPPVAGQHRLPRPRGGGGPLRRPLRHRGAAPHAGRHRRRLRRGDRVAAPRQARRHPPADRARPLDPHAHGVLRRRRAGRRGQPARASPPPSPPPRRPHPQPHADVLGPVATHRLVSSKRRRYDKMRHLPAGFVAMGDAVASFNPVYGQGQSVAVLEAVELQACLARYGNDARLVQASTRAPPR